MEALPGDLLYSICEHLCYAEQLAFLNANRRLHRLTARCLVTAKCRWRRWKELTFPVTQRRRRLDESDDEERLSLAIYFLRTLHLPLMWHAICGYYCAMHWGRVPCDQSLLWNMWPRLVAELYALCGQLLARSDCRAQILRQPMSSSIHSLPTIRGLLGQEAARICLSEEERPIYLELIDWTYLLNSIASQHCRDPCRYQCTLNRRSPTDWEECAKLVLLHLKKRRISVKLRFLRLRFHTVASAGLSSWLEAQFGRQFMVQLAGQPGSYTDRTAFREVVRLIKTGQDDAYMRALAHDRGLREKFGQRLDRFWLAYRFEKQRSPSRKFPDLADRFAGSPSPMLCNLVS